MPGIEISNIPKTLDLQHGKHYHDLVAGRVFSQTCTPLGLILPIYTGTEIGSATIGASPVWNPANSRVNVELISLTIAKASGTAAIGTAYLMAYFHVGSDIGGGTEITAFAATTPHNGLIGGGMASQVKSSNAGDNDIKAPGAGDAWRSLYGTAVDADLIETGIAYFHIDFDGTAIMPPGTFVWLANTLGAGAEVVTTIVWKEIPL